MWETNCRTFNIGRVAKRRREDDGISAEEMVER
jgi:hypothetical protein